MKYAKKIFLFIAVVLIIFGIIMHTNGFGRQNELTKLVVAIPFVGVSKDDIKLIEEKINVITEKEIGVTVEFPILESYYDDVTMMLSTNEQVDIMFGGYGSFMECYVDGYLCPLDDLLEQYGQNIISQIGRDKIQCCTIHNTLYGIPNNGNYVLSNNVFYLNNAILNQENIEVSDIHTMDDLEKIFEYVKEKYSDMTVLATSPKNTLLSRLYFLNTSKGIPMMALMNYGQTSELEEIFLSEEYKNELKRVRKWNLKGYYKEDIFGETRDVYARIRKGELFACLGGNEKNMKDLGMVKVCLDKNTVNYYGYSTNPYVIPNNSVSPEKSMMLLNLFYSSEEIENYLCYGIEKIHYKKLKDGSITYADGEVYNSFLKSRTMMPNPCIAYTWEGEGVDYWDKMKERNENVIQSNMMGFNFDYSKVDAEYREVVDIYNDYKWILENGFVNPEKGLKQMIADMKESGLDLVITEERIQYDAWIKNIEVNQ